MTTHTSINRFVPGENGKQKREEERIRALRKCMLLCEKEESGESLRLFWVCSGIYFINTPAIILFYPPGE